VGVRRQRHIPSRLSLRQVELRLTYIAGIVDAGVYSLTSTRGGVLRGKKERSPE
jgi:hypothetical protein